METRVIFNKVWYASKERANSAVVLRVYDKKCDLSLLSNSIHLSGDNFSLQVSDIKNISIKRRRLNWYPYIAINLITIANLKKDLYIMQLVILLIANLLGLVFGLTQKWIEVEGLVNDTPTVIYLLDGRKYGYSGRFGGTTKMYEYIKNQLTYNK